VGGIKRCKLREKEAAAAQEKGKDTGLVAAAAREG
jgi:hypothetical protein